MLYRANMTDRTSEDLFTRALAGLFLPERPSLSVAAQHELENLLHRHRLDPGARPQPKWSLKTQTPLVNYRPGRRLSPDLLLFEDGNPEIRAVFEVKLGANPQVPSLTSCRALPPAPGDVADRIRAAYAQGPAAQTGRTREDGAWQIDAYRGWAWWADQTIFGQPMALADDAVFILLSRDGEDPGKMFKHDAVSADEWIPVSFRKLVAALFDAQRDVLYGLDSPFDLSLVETDAIAALTFLAFTDDANTAATDHAEWVDLVQGRLPPSRPPGPPPLPEHILRSRRARGPHGPAHGNIEI